MGRASKIRRLPEALREQLHAMLDAGHTLDEIATHLKALGADVSRSGLGRYKQQVDKVAARLRESRNMAEAIMERMGAEAATGKSGDALIQMLTTLTTDYMLRRLDDPDAQVEVDELRALSRAIKERAQAARATQDYMGKLRDEARDTDTNWSIQDGKVQMVPRKGYLPGEAVVLTHETGLVGSPEQTQDGISVRSLLNPRLRVGGRIKLNNASIKAMQSPLKQATGQQAARLDSDSFYRILQVEFRGDTRGNDWYADLVCIGIDDTARLPLDYI